MIRIQLQTNLLYLLMVGGRMIISQRLSLEGSGSLILQSVNGKCGVVDAIRLVQRANLELLHKHIHFVLTEEFFSASRR